MNKSSKSKSDSKVFCTNSMFVGMDLHKNYLQIALMNDNGKVIKNSKVDNSIGEISKFFDNINKRKEGKKKNNDNLRVVMESSCVWYNIYEYLTEERNLDVILSNPIKTKAIASAKIKTDKIDAVKLADLLRGGYIPECYVANKQIRELRELVRHRIALVRMRTKLKNNKIHGILLMKGVRINTDNSSSNFSVQYIVKLKELNDYRINTCVNVIESLNKEIKDVSYKILSYAR